MNAVAITAVAAAAGHSARRMLVDVLSAANVSLLEMAENGPAALNAVERHRPDLLVADMHLPCMEGSEVIRRAVCSFRMPVRPAAILLYDSLFPVTNREILESHGVVLLERPCSTGSFCTAVDQLRQRFPAFSAGETARTDGLLQEIGFPDHIGRSCLRAAALLAAADERRLHNLGSRLYPIVGAICGVNTQQAERAIRHAIGLAWQSNKFENQQRIFADTIDASRGQPTCRQMISRLADILRLEG